MKLSNLFKKSKNQVLESISAYQKGLMNDTTLYLKLTYNGQTYTARPVEWVNQLITFEAPMGGLDSVFFPKNLNIEVALISKTSLFNTSFCITQSYHKNQALYYVAKIVEPIIKQQRRDSFRLDVHLDVQYQTISIDPSTFFISVKNEGNGICRNISSSGMCLACNQQLNAQDMLQLNFTLMDQPLSLVGEVLFLEESAASDTNSNTDSNSNTDTNTYLHHIHFIDLDSDTSSQLSRLIFDTQRLQLKFDR